jgi:hypothetical protein
MAITPSDQKIDGMTTFLVEKYRSKHLAATIITLFTGIRANTSKKDGTIVFSD